MKKFSFLLAMMLVLAFASSAFAAQAIQTVDGNVYYKSTTAVLDGKTMEDADLIRGVKDNQFKADSKTNYPYEIYLPSEETPANYRIHSNYTKNTDACAACHATHTAVGNSLLQWYSVYDTCMACHDGTVTTTYNVQEGKIGTGKAAFGGMFGIGNEASLSNHNVTGAMEIAAAPGGSVVAEAVAGKNRWAAEFGCESCHTPHGQGGNARILHPDANYTATKAAAAISNTYYVSPVSGKVYVEDDFTGSPVFIIKGYPYSPKVKVDGVVDSAYAINNSTGLSVVASVPALPAITTITGTAAIQVKMDIDNYLSGATDATGESVTHVAGMNGFCGACHTDYNTENWNGTSNGSAEAETGTYSKAHRHQVGFSYSGYTKPVIASANMKFENVKYMECLTCHVAHGTSTDYWTRTIGSTGTAYIADADLTEIAGSSALKRVPNMGTCEACHAKGDGNEGYTANSGSAPGAIDPAMITKDTAVIANLSILNYAALASAVDAGNTLQPFYSEFLRADGSGFFAAGNYVGAAKCEACHKEYYEGWENQGHVKSFETNAEAGLAAKFAASAGNHTEELATAVKVYTDDTLTSSSMIDEYTYTLDGGTNVLSYVYFAKYGAGAGLYYVQGTTLNLDLDDIKYVWMEHYALRAAGANVFERIAAIDEETGAIHPYVQNGTVMPSYPSKASWYGVTDGTTTKPGEGCMSCHSPQLPAYEANAAGTPTNGTPDATISCESCHGPAGKHVASPSSVNILNPETKLTFTQQQNLCLTCHTGKHNALPVAWKTSKHATNSVGCTTCHDVHNTVKGDGSHSSLRVSVSQKDQLCASCHDTGIGVDAYFGGFANSRDAHAFPANTAFQN